MGIRAESRKAAGPTLTKEKFVANSAMSEPCCSFDKGGFHFVILDACYWEDDVAYGRKNFLTAPSASTDF